MPHWMKWMIVVDTLLVAAFLLVFFAPVGEQRAEIELSGDAERGELLLQTAGCYACHTQAEEGGDDYAGGPRLETPFGDFYAPNITSSTSHGIGDWALVDFEAAVRQGRSPEGYAYYPAFPFSSYRSLTDQDVADLFVALKATEAVNESGAVHDLGFPFNIRLGLKPWRWLFATTKSANIDQSTPEGRGRYLVDAVAHCGECHNPRNSLGAFIPPYLGGNDEIPGGVWAPPIHGQALANLDWTEDDLFYFLGDGLLPDGDFIGGSMVEVIDYGTSQMPEEDRAAIAAYLFSLQRQ
jgi:mono/diheme cytochrome c family protein